MIRATRSMRPACLGAIFAAALAPVGLGQSRAQDGPTAIETAGRASLQVCRSWMVTRTCNEYGRVGVPVRIALGDQLYLEFGSNNKSLTFPVAAIRLAGDSCTLYAEPPDAETDQKKVDKLTVTPCRKAG